MVLLWLLQIAKAKRLRTHCHLTWHSIAVKLPPNTKPATSVPSRWRRRGREKTTTKRGPRTRTTISTPNAFATPRKVFLKKILFFEARHFYVYSSGPPLPRPPPHSHTHWHLLQVAAMAFCILLGCCCCCCSACSYCFCPLPIEALFYLFIWKLSLAICEYIKEIYFMLRYFVK